MIKIGNTTLLILFSYHHNNTEKIANSFANVLDAQIKLPSKVNPEELQEYSMIGFGSGIYDGSHHKKLLEVADRLPQVNNKKAFIFSTDGVPRVLINDGSGLKEKNHSELRERLKSKGYMIIGEFNCGGFNTNSFLKYIGGINKGRPNSQDLEQAQDFAQSIKKKYL